MFMDFSLLLLVFICVFNQYDCGVICYSCTEMLEDEQCQHVSKCQDNEVCFIQKYRTADNRRLYDVGCTHNQLCPSNSTVVAFGRRSVDHSHIMCHECCNGNVCNSAFTCGDHLKPQLLSCLSCGGVVDVHDCSMSTTCDKDEGPLLKIGLEDTEAMVNDKFNLSRKERSASQLQNYLCVSFVYVNAQVSSDTAYCILYHTTLLFDYTYLSIFQWSCEACFIQKYRTSTNKEYFDLGCKRYTMCLNRNPTDIFGRRTDEERHLLCEFCCTDGSLCNRNLDCGYPSECADVSFQNDGVYNVYPIEANYSKPAYCVIRNGIRWTVIHRRFNGSVDFNRNWEEYKHGFGIVKGEYWLGNEAIHLISTNRKHKLHIDLELVNGSRFYADYSLFNLNGESSQYLLNVTGYSGTAGDSMEKCKVVFRANGEPFSTRDRDNDGNCADLNHSGWWFAGCSLSNLNGVYHEITNGTLQEWYTNGILQGWYTNDFALPGIRRSEMMITKY